MSTGAWAQDQNEGRIRGNCASRSHTKVKKIFILAGGQEGNSQVFAKRGTMIG